MRTIAVPVMHFENTREVSVVVEFPETQPRTVHVDVNKPEVQTKIVSVELPDMRKQSRTELVHVEVN